MGKRIASPLQQPTAGVDPGFPVLLSRNAPTQHTTNDIVNFIENVRAEQVEGEVGVRSRINVPGQDEAMKRTERAIVEAEKFRASVEAPPEGRLQQQDVNLQCEIVDQFLNEPERRTQNNQGTNLTNLADLFTQFGQ